MSEETNVARLLILIKVVLKPVLEGTLLMFARQINEFVDSLNRPFAMPTVPEDLKINLLPIVSV